MKNKKADKAKTKRSEDLIREVLKLIDPDPDRSGLTDTPKRVVKSWLELYGGHSVNIPKLLSVSFDERFTGMIWSDTIQFHSTCEHHLLPFFGVAHVAYIPANNQVVGYSKIPRLVDAFARRLQTQERITTQVAEALFKYVAPIGVGVVLEGSHHCARCRGVRSPKSVMQTSCLLGAIQDDPTARSEFFARLPRRILDAI